jgi:Heterokaryon incompatibility protein (HET)
MAIDSVPPSFSGADSPKVSETRRSCEVCIQIDFDKYLGMEIDKPINLGTWKRILRSRKCSFCRIVVHCLRFDAKLTPYYPATEVFLNNKQSWELGIELSPYDQRRLESYSNKFDLRSRAKKCKETAYRFLVSHEETNPERQGHIQYLAYRETNLDDQQFFRRKILQSGVDVDLLKSWIHRCRKWHGGECDRTAASADDLPSNLRLIDVNKRFIIRPKLAQLEYVALSYVWGVQKMKCETGMEPAKLKRANIKKVAGEEMTELPEKLPQTIEDAIWLTRSLGFRYLWNDALCIVQDDPDDEKTLHLQHMHTIYSYAILTVAAAAGNHANHGLPGISVPRRYSQHSENVKKLCMATMFPSYSELENSSSLLWNTRGWTFQEKLLSKRILLFTDFQVYFKCSESIWTEEVIMETEELSKSLNARKGKYRWAADREPHIPKSNSFMAQAIYPNLNVDDGFEYLGSFLNYTAAVREYTTRTFTDSRDVLFAITGVLKTLEESTGHFLFALPEKHFLESLLWYPEPGTIHTRTRNDKHPSWSWISWQFPEKGASYDVVDVRAIRNLISYLFGMLFPKTGFDPTEANQPLYLATYSNLIACFDQPLLHPGHTLREIFLCENGHLRPLKFESPVNALTEGTIDFSRKIPSLLYKIHNYIKPGSQAWSPPGCNLPRSSSGLFFKTTIVSFRIGKALHGRYTGCNDESGTFELLDSKGRCAGEAWTTHGRARAIRQKETTCLTVSWSFSLQNADIHPKYIPTWRFDSEGQYLEGEDLEQATMMSRALDEGLLSVGEKIAGKMGLSIPKEWKDAGKPNLDKESAGELFLTMFKAKKGEPRPRSLWPVANIILVEWKGKIARRIGVGKIIMSAWQAAMVPDQEVILM